MANDYAKDFNFERYDSNKEEWEYYLQHFEMELLMYNLASADETQEKRRNLLLSEVGPKPFKCLVDHSKTETMNTKSYEELKTVLLLETVNLVTVYKFIK